MVTIRCTVYEKARLLRVLEKAKEDRINEFNEGKITEKLLEIDLKGIQDLIDRVNGNVVEDYMLNSKAFKEKNPSKRNGEFEINPLMKLR